MILLKWVFTEFLFLELGNCYKIYQTISFTKWRGRNLVGFKVAQHSPYTCLKKCFPSLVVVNRFKNMCVCVHLGLPQNSPITFDWFYKSEQNLWDQCYSLQAILGQVIWTPRTSGSPPDSKKWVLHQVDLLSGCWGVVSYLFGNAKPRQSMLGVLFWFSAKRLRKCG